MFWKKELESDGVGEVSFEISAFFFHLIGIVRDKLNKNIVVRITMISDVYNINVNCY